MINLRLVNERLTFVIQILAILFILSGFVWSFHIVKQVDAESYCSRNGYHMQNYTWSGHYECYYQYWDQNGEHRTVVSEKR